MDLKPLPHKLQLQLRRKRQMAWLHIENSATGTRTRVSRVRAEYPNQLDYSRACPHLDFAASLFTLTYFPCGLKHHAVVLPSCFELKCATPEVVSSVYLKLPRGICRAAPGLQSCRLRVRGPLSSVSLFCEVLVLRILPSDPDPHSIPDHNPSTVAAQLWNTMAQVQTHPTNPAARGNTRVSIISRKMRTAPADTRLF
jgi:hypothetical protein